MERTHAGRLHGKVAVITGVASGIGRATALAFLREGATVVGGDRDASGAATTAAMATAAGHHLTVVTVDATDAAAMRALIDGAVAAHGRLDCLFNNVGTNLVRALPDVTDDEWDATINTNLKSVFLGCRAAIPHLAAHGGGSIINNASNAGLIGRPGDPVYCATKHGIVGLTKSLALGHGPQNIRVNAICPGPIETPMVAVMRDAAPDAAAFDRHVAGQTALKRIASAEEVADLVVFLASDESRYITGAAIPIDGGKAAGMLPGMAFP
jgi:NAD(P)-dependent dehydrogenase (short-subunit alcohol dehydrogenase family)